MNESAGASQLEAELRELRARAYGPHPDIQDDPQALARLDELESARLRDQASAAPGERAGQEPVRGTRDASAALETPLAGAVVVSGERPRPWSLWQMATATRTGRVWSIIGCLIVVLGAWFAASWFAAPNPEAALQPTGVEANELTLSAVTNAPLAEVEETTLRGYEPYRGVQPWVADNAQGSRCLMAIEGSSLHGIRCAPPEAVLMLDIGVFPLDYTAAWMDGLADCTVIRFQLRGDAVDAYLYAPPDAD